MELIHVNYQKATWICRKEELGKVPTIGDPHLLKTGAKLYRCDDGSYAVSGYAQNGKDIDPYR
jgi:hypothetical protein